MNETQSRDLMVELAASSVRAWFFRGQRGQHQHARR